MEIIFLLAVLMLAITAVTFIGAVGITVMAVLILWGMIPSWLWIVIAGIWLADLIWDEEAT